MKVRCSAQDMNSDSVRRINGKSQTGNSSGLPFLQSKTKFDMFTKDANSTCNVTNGPSVNPETGV